MDGEWAYRLPTDTYVGDLRVLGERNAPQLDGIAWYGGNSGVEYSKGHDCSGWEEKQDSSSRCGPHPVGRKATAILIMDF